MTDVASILAGRSREELEEAVVCATDLLIASAVKGAWYEKAYLKSKADGDKLIAWLAENASDELLIRLVSQLSIWVLEDNAKEETVDDSGI